MRYNRAAPKGVVDFMLVECMLWGQSAGLQVVQFGDGAARPAWKNTLWLRPGTSSGAWCSATAKCSTTSRVCASTRKNISPVWRPRYLAAPDGLAMAGALLDVTALISGGVRKVLRK